MLYLNNFVENGIEYSVFSPTIDPTVDDLGNPIRPLGSMLTGGILNADPIPSYDPEGTTIICYPAGPDQGGPAVHPIYLVSQVDYTTYPYAPGRLMAAPYMVAEVRFDLPNSVVIVDSKPSSEPSTNTWAVGLNFKTGDQQDSQPHYGGTCQFKGGLVNLNVDSPDTAAASACAVSSGPYSDYAAHPGFQISPKKGGPRTGSSQAETRSVAASAPTLFRLRVTIDRADPTSSVGAVTLFVGDSLAATRPITQIPSLESNSPDQITAVGVVIVNQAKDASTGIVVAPAAVSVRFSRFSLNILTM